MTSQISRDEALELLKKYNQDPFHLQHAFTLEAVMRYFAREEGFGEDEEYWGITGLLHDIDFEQYPDQHCIKAPELLREGGVGANTMNDEYYATSKGLTPDLRDRFLADVPKLEDIHVDIALPSHPNQIEITDRAGTYTHESQPYLDNTVWADFIEERARQVRALMK